MVKNIKYYRDKIKKHSNTILLLGCMYGSVIVFPVYGPVLLQTVPLTDVVLMSIASLFCLTLGFLAPYHLFIDNIYRIFSYLSLFVIIVLIFLFPYLSLPLKWLAVSLHTFYIGRLFVKWIPFFFQSVPQNSRGQIISLSLIISYGLLYISNIIIPSMPAYLITLIPALLTFIPALLLKSHSTNTAAIDEDTYKQKEKDYIHWSWGISIILVYITAGITYAGIYPYLSDYSSYDRFYNVLPFVFTLFFTGPIADNYGRRYLFYLGIAFLGISFTALNMPSNLYTYFLVQSTIQIAWAFLDVFFWVIAADLASINKNTRIFKFGLSLIMWGVILGSMLTIIIHSVFDFPRSLFTFIAHIPIFLVVANIEKISKHLKEIYTQPEIIDTKPSNITFAIQTETENNIADLYKLTARETEILQLVLKGFNNLQIAEAVFISQNTVKYHMRNILRKTQTKDRYELRKQLHNFH